ncbi:MAG TPA: NlpC/P60 family protein, partial [Coriobacteriia bacterium]
TGQFIPPSRTDLLEAGDLVFFGYGGDPSQIHHVGMYVGGGVFIEAPGAGGYVRYASLWSRISSRGDYVGAVRP